MESRSNRSPRPPLEQSFDKVGTFEILSDGSILPTVTTDPVGVALDTTDFQGGRPQATP